jgi:glutathione S-transferase
MGQPLVFYELTNTLEFGQRSWSPNCWKTRFVTDPSAAYHHILVLTQVPRFVLNYKRISYKTVWVHFADVQTAMKAIGAEATSTMADGSPRYTLPTIFDPNTSKFVSDSLEIAKYLDKHYPERQVVPAGSEEELSKFAGNFFPNFGMVFSSCPFSDAPLMRCYVVGSSQNRRVRVLSAYGSSRSSGS